MSRNKFQPILLQLLLKKSNLLLVIDKEKYFERKRKVVFNFVVYKIEFIQDWMAD